jgi:nitric oxide reductase NorD protein
MTKGAVAAQRYRFLATSIAGRPLVVVASHERAYTDGSLIAVDIAGPAALVRAQVALHASLLACGSLDGPLMRRLLTRPGAAARYLLLEGVRLRDSVLRAELPSIAKTLAGPTAPTSAGPEDSLRIALSRQALPPPPDEWGVIRPSRLWKVTLPDGLPLRQPVALRFAPPGEDIDDEPEAPRLSNRLFNASGLENGALSRILRKVFDGRTRGGRGKTGLGSAAEYTYSRSGRAVGSVTTNLTALLGAESLPNGKLAATVAGWYPEWEVARHRYVAQWCRVVQMPSALPRNSRAIGSADHRFIRRLARTGLSAHPRRHEPAGEDLDLDSVIRHRVDMAAGADPGDRIWQQRSLSRRDLAVMVLLDASGSAGEGGGRTVLQQHAATAAVTVESLHRLGARVGAVSFTGRGRTLVRITRLKRFDEHDTGLFRARLAAVEAEGFTRLGAAIRHATTLVQKEGGATRQLIVVLSDGYPYDEGYEGRHATHDTRRAITEAQWAGVGCLCLSYSAEPAKAFEPATSATFEDISDLEPRIGELFHRALGAADLRRRYARPPDVAC